MCIQLSLYMLLRTSIPKPIPRNVAIDIPNMPTRMPGTTKVVHPLAVAIPQAVVGPPMFAFDASNISFWSIWNSFPNPSITTRWTDTWTNANKKILGAVLITFHTLPVAPRTAKNTCGKQEKYRLKLIYLLYNLTEVINPSTTNPNISCAPHHCVPHQYSKSIQKYRVSWIDTESRSGHNLKQCQTWFELGNLDQKKRYCDKNS